MMLRVNGWMRNTVVVLAMAALALGGCAAPSKVADGDSPSLKGEVAVGGRLSPEEKSLRSQSDRLKRTVVEGAVAGAVAGALIGTLTGRDTRSAAIGAGAGALVGGIGGYYVGKKQQAYASEEDRIDGMIADVRKDNEKLNAYIATASQVIESDKHRIRVAEQQYASGEVTLAEAKQGLSRARDNRAVIAGTVGGLKKKRDEYRYAAAQSRQVSDESQAAEMDREVAKLEKHITVLEKELNSLDAALSVSRIG